MKKYTKLKIVSIFIIILITTLSYLSLSKYQELEEIAKDNIYKEEWGIYITKYNYDFSICDFGIVSTEAVITLQTDESGERNSFYFVEYERSNLFSRFANLTNQFNGESTIIRNLSFEESVKLKENKKCKELKVTNDNLTHFPPPSQSDIDRNQQRLETEKQREIELKQAEETWNNMTPQEKIQKYTASREEIINKYGEEGYNMEIKTLQDQIDEIKKENGLN